MYHEGIGCNNVNRISRKHSDEHCVTTKSAVCRVIILLCIVLYIYFFFTSTELFAVHSETDRKTDSKQRNLKNFFVKCLKFYFFFCKLQLRHRIYV